ncbi:MAG: hypothetical protein AABX38_07530 [Candidatus Micrarchaeota archaeon]
MAKQIEPTPILKGQDIVKFYEIMHKEESTPDPNRVNLITKGLNVFSKVSRRA